MKVSPAKEFKSKLPEGLDYTPGAVCPICGQKMWDNRSNKRNPNAPDFKCGNKDECGLALWIYVPKPQAKQGQPTNSGGALVALGKIINNQEKIIGMLEAMGGGGVGGHVEEPNWDGV